MSIATRTKDALTISVICSKVILMVDGCNIGVFCHRLLAAFLVLVAATHALSPFPFGEPFERSSGSAFSAATSDVSLACGQPASVVKRTLPASHKAAVPAPGTNTVVAPVLLECLPQLTEFSATGPPIINASLSPLSPRAPPAA